MGRLTLYLATRNRNKFLEAAGILSSSPIDLKMLEVDKEEIQADDPEPIALHAARRIHRETGLPVVVDDTGLYIHHLGGFPGPYAEYVYRTIGLKGILRLMVDAIDRRACFKTSLALVSSSYEHVFNGVTCGVITREIRGSEGFGYDPIFIPEGYSRTYAEMSLDEKNRVSHRGKAFRELAKWAENTVGGRGD
ncbi:MAG: XTP/dITP diphosphatase [Desulfurococcales archaeon]|nr:XTP/dITP diphosphatase [Desulfurococcales archaeon]MCE4605588.1 XTP/dITP diphosphatase [Desulfurococcales archaeon]